MPSRISPPLPPTGSRPRELIDSLALEYLDGESGYFAPQGRSSSHVTVDGKSLATHSRIFYLLTAACPQNHLHWLASEDTHLLLEGGPVDYFLFFENGRSERITLGSDLAAGQRFLLTAPTHTWKALRLHRGASHALLANVLTPEWTPDRVKIGADASWIARHADKSPWATADFLRELIGPNVLD